MQDQKTRPKIKNSNTKRNFLTVEQCSNDDRNPIVLGSPKIDLKSMNLSYTLPNSERFQFDDKDNLSSKRNEEGDVATHTYKTNKHKNKQQNEEFNNIGISQDESMEYQNDNINEQNQQEDNEQLPSFRRNGLMMKSQKETNRFKDLIQYLRIKNKVRNLANSIKSRMQKNLTFSQFNMIGDKASDCSYLQKHNQKKVQTQSADFDFVGSRRSIIFQFLQRIDLFLPVFDPRSKMKVFLEIMNLLSIIVIFYSFCIIISFKLNIDTIIPQIALQISLGFIFINSFVNLNTGFYEDMKLQTNRQQMFMNYYRTHFIVDFLSFISIILLFIIDKIHFLGDNSNYGTNNSSIEVSDYGTLLRFIVFIPFLSKLRDFSKFMIEFEEKVIFQKQVQNIIQLIKLFASIILIDHFIACIWIFSSKLSFNIESNWQTKRDYQFQSWFSQYTLSFYYSTVTMTTVGYGDIVPTNQTEYLVSIFMMLISSGVFGFSLNQIGIIFTEMYKETEEMRRKMNIINIHMEKRNVKHPLRTQIRHYLEYVWRENKEQFQKDNAQIIEQLNDSLKKELQLHQNEKIINYLKKYYSQEFIQKAFTLIQEVQCKPQQLIYQSGQQEDIALYLVEKGRVEVFDQTNTIKQSISQSHFIHEISEGQLFGIRQFYTGQTMELKIRAVGFVSLLKISRDEFMSMLEQFPEDKESFCYIRDNLILYKDGWKSNSNCPSCGSYYHHLIDCDHIHYIPKKENICLRYNYIPKNFEQKERQKLQSRKNLRKDEDISILDSEDSDQTRKRIRLQTRYDLTEYLEQLYFDQIEYIEEYENKHLKYNLKYDYITSNVPDKDDENDDQYYDQTGLLQSTKDEMSLNQFYKQRTTSLDSSAMVQFEQNSERKDKQQDKYNQNNSDYSPVYKKTSALSPLKSPLKTSSVKPMSQEAKQKLQNNQTKFKGPRKQNQNQNQIHSPLSTPRTPKRNIFSDVIENQHDMNRLPQFPKDGLFNHVTSNINNFGSQLENIQNNQNHHGYILNQSNQGNLNQGNEDMNINKSKFQNSNNYFQQTEKAFYDEFNTLLPQHQKTYSNHLIPGQNQPLTSSQNQNSLWKRNLEMRDNLFKRTLSVKMKKFQNTMLQNMENIFKKVNPNQTIIKQNSTEEEGSEFYAMQQIFRTFDKQKNYFIYFPLNNLSYQLIKLEAKSQIGKKIYLDIISKRKQTFAHLQSSSHSLFRSKYDQLKIKTERKTSKSGRNSLTSSANKQKAQEYEHAVSDLGNNLIKRKSAFFERNQFESPREGVLSQQFHTLSIQSLGNNDKLDKNNMNEKLFSNGLFSRNDLSSNNLGNQLKEQNEGEFSPNVKDFENQTPVVNTIHKVEFKAKKINNNKKI